MRTFFCIYEQEREDKESIIRIGKRLVDIDVWI